MDDLRAALVDAAIDAEVGSSPRTAGVADRGPLPAIKLRRLFAVALLGVVVVEPDSITEARDAKLPSRNVRIPCR